MAKDGKWEKGGFGSENKESEEKVYDTHEEAEEASKIEGTNTVTTFINKEGIAKYKVKKREVKGAGTVNLDSFKEYELPKYTGKLGFKPTHKWVVIGRKKKIETKSGLILSATYTDAQDSSTNDWCDVLAIGPQCTEVKPGQEAFVLFQNRPTELKGGIFDNDTYEYFLVGEYDFTLVKD